MKTKEVLDIIYPILNSRDRGSRHRVFFKKENVVYYDVVAENWKVEIYQSLHYLPRYSCTFYLEEKTPDGSILVVRFKQNWLEKEFTVEYDVSDNDFYYNVLLHRIENTLFNLREFDRNMEGIFYPTP